MMHTTKKMVNINTTKTTKKTKSTLSIHSMLNVENNVEKGQVAFEFLIIYSLFIFLFISAMWAVNQKAMYSQSKAEQMFARETANRFAEEINLAARFPGYEKNYYFPSSLRGMKYDVTINDRLLILNYTTLTQITIFQPLTTNVSVSGGKIDTTKGMIRLYNDPDKGVIISQ